MRPGLQGYCSVSEVLWREVVIAHRHSRIAVAKDRHYRFLRDASHCEGAGRIVAQVVES